MSNFDKIYWTLIIIAILFFGYFRVEAVLFKVLFAVYVVKLVDWILRKLNEYKK